MTNGYRSYRLINGKPRWVVVNNKGKIMNYEPNKYNLKDTFIWDLSYVYGDTCDKCKTGILNIKNAFREYSKDGDWTGRWLCKVCYDIVYNRYRDMRITCCRSLTLSNDCTTAKGNNFEELTHIWRGVEILSIENNHYTGPFDHSRDQKLGTIQTKGSYGSEFYTNNEIEKRFDYLICYCASRNGKIIEAIYIFPISEVICRHGINITLNSSRSSWHEKFRVKDKDELKKVNKIWQDIIKENNLL